LNFEKVILADSVLPGQNVRAKKTDDAIGGWIVSNVVFCKQEERGAYSRM